MIEENAVMEHNTDDRSENYELFKEDKIIEQFNSIDSGEIVFMDTSVNPQKSGYLIGANLQNKEDFVNEPRVSTNSIHKNKAKHNRMNDIVTNHTI